MKLTNEQKRAHEADLRMRRNFSGFTMEMFFSVLKYQEDGCAICGRKRSKYLRLSLDHRHKTGRIDGILCWKCNKALAAFNDDPVLFLRASLYLQHPPLARVFGKELYTLPGRVDTKKRRKLIAKQEENAKIQPTSAQADKET